jgi:hypothetical protein
MMGRAAYVLKRAGHTGPPRPPRIQACTDPPKLRCGAGLRGVALSQAAGGPPASGGGGGHGHGLPGQLAPASHLPTTAHHGSGGCQQLPRGPPPCYSASAAAAGAPHPNDAPGWPLGAPGGGGLKEGGDGNGREGAAGAPPGVAGSYGPWRSKPLSREELSAALDWRPEGTPQQRLLCAAAAALGSAAAYAAGLRPGALGPGALAWLAAAAAAGYWAARSVLRERAYSVGGWV